MLFDFIRRFWVINPRLYFFPSHNGCSSPPVYQTNHALRLRAAGQVNLSRTFTKVPTSSQKFTFRIILKRAKLSVLQYLLFSETSGGNGDALSFNASDQLSFIAAGGIYTVTTSNPFRDPAAYYDIVLAVDTTQSVAASRLVITVNGKVQPLSTITIPQNYSFTALNVLNKIHRIGCSESSGAANGNYFDGIISDVTFVDGQALSASWFGYTDSCINSWVSKKYQGAVGNNGFCINFGDITNLTSLGYDISSNANHWTVNNASLTTGSTYDAVKDTFSSNYATLSPINRDPGSGTPTAINILQNANLTLLPNALAWDGYRSTIGVSSGKYYVEVDTASGSAGLVNTILSLVKASDPVLSTGYAGVTPTSTGQTIAIAVDFDTGTWTTYVANVVKSTGTISVGAIYNFRLAVGNSTASSINFGQRPWTYGPPSGYIGLCSGNLSTPVIKDPSLYFNAINLATNGGITQPFIGFGFPPDLVWIKSRDAVSVHSLFDTIRGPTNYIQSSANSAEMTDAASLKSFDQDGFTLGSSFVTDSSRIAWAWQTGNNPVTNTDGTISATINVNQLCGFSIVSYIGSGAASTVGHGLASAPDLVIVKDLDSAVNWFSWATPLSNSSAYLNFNSSAKSASSSNLWGTSGIGLKTIGLSNKAGINSSGKSHVAYCFDSIPGFSLVSQFAGNGSADGTFVYCGFRPAFILIKRIDASDDWRIIDTSRSPFNVVTNMLLGDSTASETTSTNMADILSNGFKLRSTTANTNGGSYLFYAVAEQSFKFANAR